MKQKSKDRPLLGPGDPWCMIITVIWAEALDLEIYRTTDICYKIEGWNFWPHKGTIQCDAQPKHKLFGLFGLARILKKSLIIGGELMQRPAISRPYLVRTAETVREVLTCEFEPADEDRHEPIYIPDIGIGPPATETHASPHALEIGFPKPSENPSKSLSAPQPPHIYALGTKEPEWMAQERRMKESRARIKAEMDRRAAESARSIPAPAPPPQFGAPGPAQTPFSAPTPKARQFSQR